MSNDLAESETESKLASTRFSRRSSRTRYWAMAAAAVTAIACILFLWGQDRHRSPDGVPASEDRSVSIQAVQARTAAIGQYLYGLGTVTPLATVNVYSQVSGQVVAVRYSEGHMVRKGEPLLEIDPRPYQAALDQSMGALARDQAQLDYSRAQYERYKALFEQGVVSREQLGTYQSSLGQFDGAIKTDRAAIETAQLNLTYCHITAPISGRVGLRLVDTGNVVFAGGGTPLALITQLQPITVVFNVSEDHVGEIQRAMSAQKMLKVDAFDRAGQVNIASGALLTLDNEIDTSTGTLRLRGIFRNDNLSLFPNQFVNAQLHLRTLRQATVVPAGAIQRRGDKAFVYRLAGGRARLWPVVEQAAEGEWTAVQGIQPGDWIATSSFDKLQDNTAVSIQSAPATPQFQMTDGASR